MSFIKKHIKAIKIMAAASFPIIAAAIILYMKLIYEPGHGIACFTHKYLGIYCMGCGSTRQLYYLLQGQFKKAFHYNVACVIIYPAYAYLYYLILRWAIKGENINYKQAYLLAAFALTLILYMILRNIPIRAFDFLRPLG